MVLPMTGALPSPIKRLLRVAALNSPRPIRRLVIRVPFSRFAGIATRWLWGTEQVAWRGLNVEVNPGESMGYCLYMLDVYATPEIDKLVEVCRTAEVFADIGSNIGLVALAVANACPGLRVMAFEPDASAQARFRRNLALNLEVAKRIQLHEVAASDSNGTAMFAVSEASTNPETGHLVTNGYSGEVQSVPCRRLDELFAEHGAKPDVVKIDVEGAELSVLHGMSGLLERARPKAILLEVHGFCFGDAQASFKRELAQLLETAGYGLQRLTNDGRWIDDREPSSWPPRCHVLATLR